MVEDTLQGIYRNDFDKKMVEQRMKMSLKKEEKEEKSCYPCFFFVHPKIWC